MGKSDVRADNASSSGEAAAGTSSTASSALDDAADVRADLFFGGIAAESAGGSEGFNPRGRGRTKLLVGSETVDGQDLMSDVGEQRRMAEASKSSK